MKCCLESHKYYFKLKYLFLLNKSATQDFLSVEKKVCDKFVNNKTIKTFFELIGCDWAYIENFSDNLGQKLIRRYKAVYKMKKVIIFLKENIR